MNNLPQFLRTHADVLDDYNYPLRSADRCRQAADEIERLQVENAKLKKPDWYYDRDYDDLFETLKELVDERGSGQIASVRLAHVLSAVYVLIPEEGGKIKTFETKEAAEAARKET